MKCRFCQHELTHQFVDLVNSPPSNAFLTLEELNEPEIYYPLKLFVCEQCFLVQIEEYKKSQEIFDSRYAYFSSYSRSWLDHAERYVTMVVERLGLDGQSQVIEIASNDGYLLQYFVTKNIPVLGIEPASNVARVAQSKGIETITDFFGERLANQLVAENRKADLLVGNNVFAHVPKIHDFVIAMKTVLKEGGVITMEFPHLMQLIVQNQFDTIYHEHFSYFSFSTAKLILERHGLEIFDVEEIPTHGGSLRIYAKHEEDGSRRIFPSVPALLENERSAGMNAISYYENFQEKVDLVKYELLSFLLEQKVQKKKVVAYGAAAKGNTLLNYCGIKRDLVDFVVDASPHKQGKFLPGSHLPVFTEDRIKQTKPDYVIILPWNIRDEIMDQLRYIREWAGGFVLPIPVVTVL